MIAQDTPKTEPVAAKTSDGGNNFVEILLLNRTLDSVLAVWGGAPLQSILILNVCPGEQGMIPVSQIGGKEQVERAGIDYAVAAVGGALDAGSLALLTDLLG